MKREQVSKILINRQDIKQRFAVKHFYLFGSVGRGEERENSDVDILVEFEPDARVTLFQFTKLQRELTQLLHCRVDLATPGSLHKELRDAILKEAILAA
jgi:hypothetical protein